ncbi:lamin tail domain-containing protein [Bacteroidia bacterium]|nr:lamin tail domain-containing protein [Bacteroidia bacterium]
MKKIYILVVGLLLTCGAFAQCSGLYFSEYAEGSSNNKYLEIYNASGADVNMSDYAVVRLNGGSTSPDTFVMNGTLGAYEVYTIANASADATILAVADTTGSATFYNGDDALTLVNVATMTAIDIIGVPGTDPGSEWAVGSGSTKEHTLVRMSSVTGGQTDWAAGATEWNVYPQNTWDYAGSHASICSGIRNASYDVEGDDSYRDFWRNLDLEAQLPNTNLLQITSSPVHTAPKAAKFPSSGDRIAYQAVTVKPLTTYVVRFWYTIKTNNTGSATVTIMEGDIRDTADIAAATITTKTVNDQTSANDYVLDSVVFTSGSTDVISILITNEGEECRFDSWSMDFSSEPMAGAPTPTADAADVISLFSNAYTDVTVDTWRTGWSNATLTDIQLGTDDVKRYTNLDFVGIEAVGANSIDASGMDHISFDAWTPNATTYRIKLVDFGADNAFGGGDDSEHEVVINSPGLSSWNTHQIALSDMTGLSATSNISQIIFSALPTAGATLYVDNIYFYQTPEPAPMTAAAAPTADAVDVISLFSNTYTDVTVDTWRTGWSNATLEDIQVAGDDVKKYSALDFVGIETVGANSIDASGMDYFTFDAWTPNATTYRVKLVDFGADNAFGGGDDTEHEIAFANPTQETWTNHTINLSDFTGLTGKSNISQIIFSALPTAGTTLYIDNVYFSRDPVLNYTVSTIADVIMLDADLAPTNEDALYEVTGVVYGGDLDGNAGLSFTIIDATAGINVFNFTDVSDYVVTEGDEITVRGKIDFYRGLLEIVPDSIKVNSQGNALKAPTTVAAPSEATESDFIVLEKVWITNDTTTIWPDNGNVELTNENADTFLIRIDRDIPGIVGEPVAFDTMTITGIGGQFDFSAPYDEGYQIFPRGLGDIAEWVATSEVKFSVDMKRHKASGATWGTVNLNGTFNDWNGSDIVMTDDDMDDVYEVTVTVPNGDIEWKYTLDGWNAQEEFVGGESCTKTTGEFTNRYIEVTADTEIAVVCYNKCITCEEAEASVNDIALNQVTVYPNPTQGNLTVESNEAWTSYEVYSVLGLKVAEGQMVNNTLSVQSLTEGTYLLKLKSDTNAGAARFVINR